MDKHKRRFRRGEHQEEELRLDDVLEPYDQDEPADDEQSGQTFALYEDEAGPLYEQQPSYGEQHPPYEPAYDAQEPSYEEDQPPYGDPYDEEYSGYHEAMDEAMNQAGRFKVAMGVFDTVSILVGIGVILLLVAMLVSLVSWLRSDILHSALLLQSGLQSPPLEGRLSCVFHGSS